MPDSPCSAQAAGSRQRHLGNLAGRLASGDRVQLHGREAVAGSAVAAGQIGSAGGADAHVAGGSRLGAAAQRQQRLQMRFRA